MVSQQACPGMKECMEAYHTWCYKGPQVGPVHVAKDNEPQETQNVGPVKYLQCNTQS